MNCDFILQNGGEKYLWIISPVVLSSTICPCRMKIKYENIPNQFLTCKVYEQLYYFLVTKTYFSVADLYTGTLIAGLEYWLWQHSQLYNPGIICWNCFLMGLQWKSLCCLPSLMQAADPSFIRGHPSVKNRFRRVLELLANVYSLIVLTEFYFLQ